MNRSHTTRDQLKLTTVDLLAATAQEREDVRAAMLAVQHAVYNPATHDQLTLMDATTRVTRYVDQALDVATYDHFNFAVLFHLQGRPVAVGHMYTHLNTIEGTTYEIMRASTNILPMARSLNLISAALSQFIYAYCPRNLVSPHPRYYLGYCMSPVMYHFIHRRVRRLHPSPTPPTPQEARLYKALVGHSAAALPEHVGSQTDARTERWLAHTNSPSARYFMEQNPRWREGFALPILTPVNTLDALYTVAMTSWIHVRRQLTFLVGRGHTKT